MKFVRVSASFGQVRHDAIFRVPEWQAEDGMLYFVCLDGRPKQERMFHKPKWPAEGEFFGFRTVKYGQMTGRS